MSFQVFLRHRHDVGVGLGLIHTCGLGRLILTAVLNIVPLLVSVFCPGGPFLQHDFFEGMVYGVRPL